MLTKVAGKRKKSIFATSKTNESSLKVMPI